MKNILAFLFIIQLHVFIGDIYAQDVTTVEAKTDEISENLDLEAVASVFGEAEDLEDFETKLNDPTTQITNLDLNGDGEVDYLRVLETSIDNTHLITIQAAIGEDLFQDVATIEVEKDNKGETQVQVVGDVYMYGPNYIVEPVYVHPPVFFVLFWQSHYRPWYSPYYFGYYPPYYRPWRPYPPHRYRSNVHVHVNINNTYNRTTVRKSKNSIVLQKKVKRNDFAKKNPNKSFEKRNKGATSKTSTLKRNNSKISKPSTQNKSSGRKVQKNWSPPSKVEKSKYQKPSTGTMGNNKSVQKNKSNINTPKSTNRNSNIRSKPTQVKKRHR